MPDRASVTTARAADDGFRTLSENQAAILNALPAHVALLDAHGVVVAANEAWRRFGSDNGVPPGGEIIGTSYLEVCDHAVGECAEEARAVGDGIRQVLRGQTPEFSLEYPCHAPHERRWFRVMVTPVRDVEPGGAVVTHVDVTQRKLAEDALRASETHLRAIVESEPECVKTVSVDGRLLDMNPAGLCMIEADGGGDVFGQPVLDLIHPADRARFTELHERVSGGESGELQFRIVGKKGTERWVETHSTPLRDLDGTIGAVLSITRDVTERKRLERLEACETRVLEAISSGERLGAILETTALGIEEVLGDGQVSVLLLDEDGQHVRHAAAPHLPVAYARAIDGEAIGPNAGSCGTAAYRKEPVVVEDIASDPLWSDYRDLALAHGLRACWSTPVIDTDGRVLATFAVYHREPRRPRPADQEVIDRAVHLVRLAVQRAQREDALRASEERLRMASRISRMGAWWVDLAGSEPRLHGSPELREILGISPDYVPDMTRELERYVPEHREAMWSALVACMREGRGFDLQLEVLDATGRRLWTRSIGEALRDDSGRIVGVQGAFQDISAQKAAEQSLAESQRRFRDLADAMPIIVFTSLPHGEVDYVNQAFAQYAGIAEADLGNVGWLRAVHPDDVKHALSSASESIARGVAHAVQFRLRRASDGAYRWHQIGAVPVRDAAGQIVKWYGSAADIDDVVRLEQNASALARRLVTTLESITDAFFTVDRDWRFTYWNAEAERKIGRKREELLGRTLWEAFPDAKGSIFEQQYRQAVADNVAVTFEAHYPPIDRWLEIRVYPSSEGLAGYFRDITDLRAAREAMQESEERFRLLARATNDAIWDWNYVTDALWWNEGFETLFGFSRTEIEPTIDSWYCRIHPDERDEVVAGIHRAVADGAESWVREYRFLRKDGSYAYVLDRGHVIRDAAGKAIRMIGGMTDLTERRAAEERLAEQAALLDAAHEAIVVADLDGTIIYWNRGAERTFGWLAPEALGQKHEQLLSPEPGAYAEAQRLLRERGEWQGEMTKRTKDGQELTVDVRWTLVRDAAGRPKSVLAIDTDVTERKKLEQQFLRAQRMESIGTLAGGIAHDLNNLLAPISMGVELMKTYDLDAKCGQILASMELSARRGIDLVKQVLSFARGMEGSRVTIAIEDVTREVESIVERTFPKSLELTREICTEPWPVLGDPTQLNQVLLNLCVNARDAMPDGGRLTIAVRNRVFDDTYAAMNRGVAAGRYVEIEVSDTGCGIPAHLRDRVFEPFFTTKEIGKGTGLGLSTVIGIVRSHGGFVNVYSEVGKGTSFRVCLPAREDTMARGLPHGAVGEPLPRGNGELVLVVDDEASILHITRQTLEAFGYRALTAEDGAQAIGLFALHREDIAAVVTDMMMPVMDGLALIAALRRIDPDVRVIASSGLNANGHVARLAHADVEHFLAKPYSAEELLQTLRAVLASADAPRRPDAAPPGLA